MARLSKRLTVKISPHAEGKYAVTVTDSETRSTEGKRRLKGTIAADTWEAGTVVDAFAKIWEGFHASCIKESPDDLFSEQKSAKPKVDQ